MKSFALNGTLRKELGKKATKAVRANGNIPCILYGNGKTIATFEVTSNDVRKLVYTPEIFVVELTIDGKSYKAVMQELQFHPVKDTILHIDFLEVTDSKPVVVKVPVVSVGHAEGVKAGGKLIQNVRRLKVKALYTNIPETLQINVETLGLNKSIQVKDLSFDNLELLDNPQNVVITVKPTRAAAAAMAAAKNGK
ncbi:MAG: 50S ribosomal protein L25/general stress protein Ctc [Paludibacteraceae bacterium]|nr:50S ribosomal protein L25/general stress protein Ctc [Paludibacteraceae bacterium]